MQVAVADLGRSCSTHAWYPGGLYVGTHTGQLYAAMVPPPQPAHHGHLHAQHHHHAHQHPAASRAASAYTMGAASAAASAHQAFSAAPSGRTAAAASVGAAEEGGGAADTAQGEEEEAAAAAAAAGPEVWDAVLVAEVWGGVPITALAVSRDVVAVGGPEAVQWLTHPQRLESGDAEAAGDAEEEAVSGGLAEQEGGSASVRASSDTAAAWEAKGGLVWRMRKCGGFELGPGAGVAALAYGRHVAAQEEGEGGGQVALGSADGRVLLLELGPMVAALEAAEAQQVRRSARACFALPVCGPPSVVPF